MADLIKARCPGCKRELRIPAEWIKRAFRCKHCRTVIQAKPKSGPREKPVAGDHPGSGPPAAPLSTKAPAKADEETKNAVVAGHTESAPDAEAGLVFPAVADAPIIRMPSGYRPSQRSRWVTLLTLLILVGIGSGAVYYFRTALLQLGGSVRDGGSQGSPKSKDQPAADSKLAAEVAPRRVLAICVNHYLYANPVAYGDEENDFGALLDKLGEVLRIDPSQVVELSDAARARQPRPAAVKKGKGSSKAKTNKAPPLESPARPPLKPVIEKTVTDFLAGCRAQDRIILLFAGHVTEVDGEAFLVPLEGELRLKETLIPLSWLFQRLTACPARQKVFILDTCRLDPERGLERPGSGPMEDKLDALLAKPPDGIQLWTACVKGQYSYEIDGGSFFLKKLMGALAADDVKKTHEVDEPLPVAALAAVVDKKVETDIAAQLKEKQTPRLTGKEAAEGAPYDAAQPLPARLVIPRPSPPAGGMASLDDVKSILDEIDLPPMKLARRETARLQIEVLVPFSAKKLEEYRPDYSSTAEIENNAGKFPLRVAVLKTVKLIRDKFDPKNDTVLLRENFAGNTNDRVKAEILKEQARPAELLEDLREAREMLEEAGKSRAQEPSKRWQAHYDFILAQVLARVAYLEEYSLMLGKIRKDELPPLENGQTGFRLASRDKLQGTKEFKDMASRSKKILEKLATEHKGTPWEILAKREQLTALGLQWQPTR